MDGFFSVFCAHGGLGRGERYVLLGGVEEVLFHLYPVHGAADGCGGVERFVQVVVVGFRSFLCGEVDAAVDGAGGGCGGAACYPGPLVFPCFLLM